MQTATEQQPTLNYDEIAKAAREIWQQEGCPQGRDLEHWLKAERQLLAAKNSQSGKPLNPAGKPKASATTVRRSTTR